MTRPLRPLLALTLIACASTASAQTVVASSEQDYFDDMPVVLSVSRLPQRLDETPGAVTVLDRDFIRQSGARDVADLLRLVPGFQSSTSFEADAPQASYHGSFGLYSARLQVLVDGRSVYSTYFFGSVAPGLMSVAMEDIERIEVLRGSNSVAYGARAMFGVVNIVTRHTSETMGSSAAISRGENGIQDTQVALGWKTQNSGMRLGIDQRGDDGLAGANGANRVQRVNFRSDWRVSNSSNVEIRAGLMNIDAGRGFPRLVDAPVRDTSFDSSYVQVDWKKVLSADQDVAVMFAHNKEAYRDVAPFRPLPGVNLDVSGSAYNDSLMAQHTLRLGNDVRMVWGAELRRESVTSLPVYNTSEALVTDFERLFTHAEWRIRSDLLLNAGLMAEHISASGSSLAPRLMLNWHVTPRQTLRIGASRSYRPPSTLETDGDIRYSLNGRLLQVTLLSLGNVQNEALLTRELGYFGRFSWLNSTLDVRVFDESLTGLSQRQKYRLPPSTSLFPSTPVDYVNGDNFSVRGLELQWTGQPWPGAKTGFNQTFSRVVFPSPPTDFELVDIVPAATSTLFFSQQLPMGLRFSLNHQNSDPFRLQKTGNYKQFITRTDWRLSKSLRMGGQTGELAFTVQNQGQPYADFDQTFAFNRRAFVSLRLDH